MPDTPEPTTPLVLEAPIWTELRKVQDKVRRQKKELRHLGKAHQKTLWAIQEAQAAKTKAYAHANSWREAYNRLWAKHNPKKGWLERLRDAMADMGKPNQFLPEKR